MREQRRKRELGMEKWDSGNEQDDRKTERLPGANEDRKAVLPLQRSTEVPAGCVWLTIHWPVYQTHTIYTHAVL